MIFPQLFILAQIPADIVFSKRKPTSRAFQVCLSIINNIMLYCGGFFNNSLASNIYIVLILFLIFLVIKNPELSSNKPQKISVMLFTHAFFNTLYYLGGFYDNLL